MRIWLVSLGRREGGGREKGQVERRREKGKKGGREEGEKKGGREVAIHVHVHVHSNSVFTS